MGARILLVIAVVASAGHAGAGSPPGELERSRCRDRALGQVPPIVELDRSVRDRLGLTFVIEEGPVAELTQVRIEGAPRELLAEAELETEPSGVLHTGRWVDTVIERDRRRLLQHLRRRGYLDAEARIERRSLRAGELGLVFVVKRGERKVVDRVAFEGVPAAAGDPSSAVSDVPGAALTERTSS